MSDRYDAFPSRMVLQTYKTKKKAAAKGHNLLQKKADALKARQRMLLEEIYSVKLEMNQKIKDATFSHSKAVYAGGDFNKKVLSQISDSPKMKVGLRCLNVTGVELLDFTLIEDVIGRQDLQIGLNRGGEQIDTCKKAFEEALKLLVRLGGLQTSFAALEQAIKVTNRRVNALEYVVLPKIVNTISYILSELDEREREDLFRLKKVIENKKKLALAKEEELKERLELYEDTHGYGRDNVLDQFQTVTNDDAMVDDMF